MKKFILYGNETAITLYKKSKEALINSNCYDFMIYQCDEDIDMDLHNAKQWDKNITINKSTYDLLYKNLCWKLRKFTITPEHKKQIKKYKK